jgi:cobalamin biosynthetic protein CobC
MSLAAELAGHGGRLCVARALYPRAPEPWIDLSTGINPEPYPAPHASAAARGRLPTPEEISALEVAAGRAFGVDDADRITAAAGSEAVLRLMPYALRAEAAVVVGPTYSSHGAAWRQAGFANGIAPDTGVPLDVAVRFAENNPPRSVITLVNPNNPDGAVISRERLLSLHDDIASCDGHLVVDEAFADIEPHCSVAAIAGTARYPRLVVLRSFGKFYGLAGVRLGFVIGAPPIITRFRELLGDWPVSADAIAAGLAAYADDAWAKRTRERLLHAARRLDDLLISSGFDIVGGTSLFRLARSANARDRFETLLRAGVLARPFDHDPTLLRFGLPHEPAAWQRLAEALRKP